MYRITLLSLVLGAVSSWATVPFPAANFPYFGKIEIGNQKVQSTANLEALKQEAVQACRFTHRALFAIETYYPEIQEMFGTQGANFPVLYKNREFYRKHLANRYAACTNGKILFRMHGVCGTERETVAFVKTTLGWAHSTINICDEYFADGVEARAATILHEYGRLENIADSVKFDTNNIYVWDVITGRLGDAATFQQLSVMKANKKP